MLLFTIHKVLCNCKLTVPTLSCFLILHKQRKNIFFVFLLDVDELIAVKLEKLKKLFFAKQFSGNEMLLTP